MLSLNEQSLVRTSLLAKTLFEQSLDRLQRIASIFALRANLHLHALLGTKHHQAGHAFGADLVLATRDRYLGRKSAGGLCQRRGGTKMEPQSIFDLYRRLRNTHGIYDTGYEDAGKLIGKPKPQPW